MADDAKYKRLNNSAYTVRILFCIALTELIMLFAVVFWPVSEKHNTPIEFDSSRDALSLEHVVITRQESSPPPPPRPQVPVPVPNDKIIDEEILILQDFDISHYADSVFVGKGSEAGADGQIVTNPQTSPSILRIVEPATPDAAQRAGIKAQIWVNLLVNKKGEVEDAFISKIELYDEELEDFREVQSINYGLAEATLEAALEWQFRPATNNGEPVKAYSEQIFTFGF